MARPREFDQNDVLDKVVGVFWSRGFEATSIQDLEEATGLKRGSLYNAFGDKATLFHEAFDHYMQQSAVRRVLNNGSNGSARDTIDAILDAVVEEGSKSKKGCLLTNTITELAGRDPGGRRLRDRIGRPTRTGARGADAQGPGPGRPAGILGSAGLGALYGRYGSGVAGGLQGR